MFKIRIIIILVLAVLLIQCSSKPTIPVQNSQLDETINLQIGQSAVIESEDLTITFTKFINESRCPSDPVIFCFWPGMASIEVEIQKSKIAPVTELMIIYGDANGTNFPPVYAFGYQFEMRNLLPYPPNFDPIDPEEYTASINISIANLGIGDYPKVKISDTSPLEIMLDDFELQNIQIEDDLLSLTVSYGGGCSDHFFFLHMSPAAFLESYPVQANLYLRHIGNGDPCDAWLTKTITFDISPIMKLYQDGYSSKDQIILNIYEYFEDQPGDKISITYEP